MDCDKDDHVTLHSGDGDGDVNGDVNGYVNGYVNGDDNVNVNPLRLASGAVRTTLSPAM